jgi:hypothetical protein
MKDTICNQIEGSTRVLRLTEVAKHVVARLPKLLSFVPFHTAPPKSSCVVSFVVPVFQFLPEMLILAQDEVSQAHPEMRVTVPPSPDYYNHRNDGENAPLADVTFYE